jgi:hypothetical protein
VESIWGCILGERGGRKGGEERERDGGREERHIPGPKMFHGFLNIHTSLPFLESSCLQSSHSVLAVQIKNKTKQNKTLGTICV